jgi:hypothetical protein
MKITYEIHKAVDAVKELDIDEDQYHGSGLMLTKVGYYKAGDHILQAVMYANGFEASRKLTLDDVEAIRDWCDEVLMAARKAEKEAA